MSDAELTSCPFVAARDDRKSAGLAAQHLKAPPGSAVVSNFSFARELLRSPKVKQAGAGADQVDVGNPEHVPVFYLDGEMHKRRRAAITKFFTPKTVQTRYRELMERTTDRLLQRLRDSGSTQLDQLSFELACTVAAEIIGLTDSDPHGMAGRIARLLNASFRDVTGLRRLLKRAKETWYGLEFYVRDVRPAVRERRAQRREDVISQVIDKNYSERAIMIECLTYAAAGMVTTREFIVMVAWYMFGRPELRARFLAAGEDGQLGILQEILRLEPVAGLIYRRVDEALESSTRGVVQAGAQFAIDMRAVNTDEAIVGECPFELDPERAAKQQQSAQFMSFGDGAHHCPGWQVALHETRVFIDRLLRVPGIRLEREPDMHWNSQLMSYELRDAVVACDRS